MIKFIADSSCDTRKINDTDINIASLRIYTEERDYLDDENLDIHEMLDYLLAYKDRSYTACPSTESWLNAFEGGDEIYVVTMTSGLSGTYNSACVARDLYLEDHPDSKILIVDTLSTGPEMRLMLEKIIDLKKAGKSFEFIENETKAYLSSTRLFFAFKSLHNLAQNGRVNKIVASLIGKLNISIIGTASKEGTIEPIAKSRGVKNVFSKLIEEMTKAGFAGGKVRICHVENEELASGFGAALKNLFPNLDINIYPARGLVSYYAERYGIVIACEC
ncbi:MULTISPECIES: DegV family protein [Lachnospira]|jgi:DegV family protein with EDD domain|uniref:EDD domain protein, DegV family n=1 Tax=Lachnospira pectinoschiza TaxID=28052 RepID=A0A1G9YSG9_9FIRM|nr:MULTISPECIES: DegV family protein [Lachnospira]SDN12084.1 EDD domain protein, DegV family [Lachnospira pectinoschiza]